MSAQTLQGTDGSVTAGFCVVPNAETAPSGQTLTDSSTAVHSFLRAQDIKSASCSRLLTEQSHFSGSNSAVSTVSPDSPTSSLTSFGAAEDATACTRASAPASPCCNPTGQLTAAEVDYDKNSDRGSTETSSTHPTGLSVQMAFTSSVDRSLLPKKPSAESVLASTCTLCFHSTGSCKHQRPSCAGEVAEVSSQCRQRGFSNNNPSPANKDSSCVRQRLGDAVSPKPPVPPLHTMYHEALFGGVREESCCLAALRDFIGCTICSTIAALYYLCPVWFLFCLFHVTVYWSLYHLKWIAAFFILAWLPKFECKRIRTSWLLRCIAHYFDIEILSEEDRSVYMDNEKNFLMLVVPHGVISFGGLAAATLDPPVYGPTAVANVLLRLPILRHLFSFFGTVGSDRKSLVRALQEGHVFLYPGGMAELFLSDRNKEEIFFENRKGCVKVAMESGADILVCYIMGNTEMFNVVNHGPLARFSRAIQSSVTFFWGRWGLPIPFKAKVLFLVGRPIKVPTRTASQALKAEIDEIHAEVKKEILRLFETHKHRHPAYAKKTLTIR